MHDPAAPQVELSELLSERLGAFQILTFVLCVFIFFVDGLDYSAANVAAPAILRAFGGGSDAMGIVFGWGYFGILVGSVVFGIIGDKYGRKTGAILGVLAYSLPALATAFATSLDQLAVFRCLAGLGIGGVLPNTVALLTETAPKRLRITFVMAAFVGYSAGNASVAQIAAYLIPTYGWQIVFWAAGISGSLLALVLILALPESIPFLAATRPDSPRLRKLVRRAAPELVIGPDTRFLFSRPANETKFSLSLLFSGVRRFATPVIWIAFFAESLTYMTLTAWLAVILERAGLTPTQAALAYSYAQLGAIAAILILARSLDRFGPKAGAISALIAVASIMALGRSGMSPLALTVLAIVGIACASATHQALIGIVGGLYPIVIRGNGVGYASGMGRVAAIIGPLIAGLLLSRLPLAAVLVVIATPDLSVAAACIMLGRIRERVAAPLAPKTTPAS